MNIPLRVWGSLASFLLAVSFFDSDWNVLLLGVIISIWQGILLWIVGPGEKQAPTVNASQSGQA